jgi:hypothetical protein
MQRAIFSFCETGEQHFSILSRLQTTFSFQIANCSRQPAQQRGGGDEPLFFSPMDVWLCAKII